MYERETNFEAQFEADENPFFSAVRCRELILNHSSMLTKTHFKAQRGLVARSVRFKARLMSTKTHFEALFVADENPFNGQAARFRGRPILKCRLVSKHGSSARKIKF